MSDLIYIIKEIEQNLAFKKSVGFVKRSAFHDEYGCIFKVERVGPGLSWYISYISIKDDKMYKIEIGENTSLRKFGLVSRGFMPGYTLGVGTRVDCDSVQETWKIADAKITE